MDFIVPDGQITNLNSLRDLSEIKQIYLSTNRNIANGNSSSRAKYPNTAIKMQ